MSTQASELPKTGPSDNLDDERRRTLAERAAKLARKASRDESTSTDSVTEVVFFRRGRARYGAELLLLRDIQETRGLTRVPSTPPWCLGVINLRGEIVPVLDLPPLLDSIPVETSIVGRVLVLEHEGRRLGLAADDVDDSISLRPADLHQPLSTFHGQRSRLVQWIADRDALIIDGRRLLADDHLFT